MRRLFFVVIAIAGCSSGPTIPDGGKACSIDADCSPMSCLCPLVYQNCVDGLCSTVCPVEDATPTGQTCGDDCECASEKCGADMGICCPTVRNGASGAGCQADCDCISVLCTGNVCQ